MTCQSGEHKAPLYYTLSSIDSFDGRETVIGIFDSMRSIGFRLQRVYSTCGDEYKINCYHLADAVQEAAALTEQQVNRAKYERENRIKDKLYKEAGHNDEDKDEDYEGTEEIVNDLGMTEMEEIEDGGETIAA
tara:strand:+ start:606 stop:1004 length:399 start_codon:yes stop_codon:yes gene_type:complete